MSNEVPDIQFEDGESWSCTGCGQIQTIEWDEELEETVGMPGYYSPDEGVVLCDICGVGGYDVLGG